MAAAPRGGDDAGDQQKGGAMQRIAVIAKLREGAADEARELLDAGPPFDPDALGFDRHAVYVSDDEVIFIFEGARVASLVRTLSAAGGGTRQAFAAWEPLIVGLPRLAQEAYFWQRPAPVVTGSWGE
jgi:hypothetical protein